MILYNIIYYSSFPTGCNFCSRVAKVARQNVYSTCARNGLDSTLVFDVTNQVRQRYKECVITRGP